MSKNGTTCKVFAQAFFKKLEVSKGSALVARRNERNFTLGFSFWLEQERARWAMKRVRSTEKTRSVECDLAFKATMFLTGQVFFFWPFCVKRKSVIGGERFFIRGTGCRGRQPLPAWVVFLYFACRGGYYPPVIYKNIIVFCSDDPLASRKFSSKTLWSPLRI